MQNDEVSWNKFFRESRPLLKTIDDQRQVVDEEIPLDDPIVANTRVYMKNCAFDDAPRELKEFEFMGKRLQHVKLKEFEFMAKRLQHAKLYNKKYDRPLFWKLDGIHLCENYFTSGMINVERGMAYCIHTGKADMDAYLTHMDAYPEKYLPQSSSGFTKKKLEAGKEYIIKNSFLLVATKNCMFKIIKCPVAVNKRPSSADQQIPYPAADIPIDLSKKDFIVPNASVNAPTTYLLQWRNIRDDQKKLYLNMSIYVFFIYINYLFPKHVFVIYFF